MTFAKLLKFHLPCKCKAKIRPRTNLSTLISIWFHHLTSFSLDPTKSTHSETKRTTSKPPPPIPRLATPATYTHEAYQPLPAWPSFTLSPRRGAALGGFARRDYALLIRGASEPRGRVVPRHGHHPGAP